MTRYIGGTGTGTVMVLLLPEPLPLFRVFINMTDSTTKHKIRYEKKPPAKINLKGIWVYKSKLNGKKE